MASSSVSQDDIEVDYEISSRRSRIRTARARNFNPSATRPGDGGGEDCDGGCPGLCALHPTTQGAGAEHDISPKPSNRVKEKRVSRSTNINKGKQQRDRRKLREKRRSTGVVHVPSTEVMTSTGGSEDEELQCVSSETRRNTGHNVDGSSSPQPGYAATEHNKPKKQFPKARNKSPSDLEADDEDNQDYDSLTMSDSTLSLAQPSGIVVGGTGTTATKLPFACAAGHHHHRSLAHSSSKYDLLKKHQQQMPVLTRGTTYCSGMCSKGGYIVQKAATPRTGGLLTANRPHNGRPATPASESCEELLERAREENKRLLELLAEREQRIAVLEGRLALVSNRPTRSFESPAGGYSNTTTTSAAAAAAAATGYHTAGMVAATNGAATVQCPSSNSSPNVVTSGSSSNNMSSNNMSSSVNNGLDGGPVTHAVGALTTD